MIQTILTNGNIITLDERRPRVSALAISYGRAVALGDDAEIRRLARRGCTPQSSTSTARLCCPGSCDAHLHWEAQARALRSVECI